VSRIPRPLARKLDRLARRAHRFHRFAHHPLCDEYAGELVRLGARTRVCRGCACALAGATSGAVGTLMLPLAVVGGTTTAPAIWIALGLALVCGVALAFDARRTAMRSPKTLTRLLPAAAFTFACVLGARSASLAGLALLATSLATGALLYMRYRKRGPSRTPCQTCPERTQSTPCRGYAPIVRRERAFARIARRMLA